MLNQNKLELSSSDTIDTNSNSDGTKNFAGSSSGTVLSSDGPRNSGITDTSSAGIPKKSCECLYPEDLLPFTRFPMFIIAEATSSNCLLVRRRKEKEREGGEEGEGGEGGDEGEVERDRGCE